jgi:hypothetical protein
LSLDGVHHNRRAALCHGPAAKKMPVPKVFAASA